MKQTFDRHIYRILLAAVGVLLGGGTILYHYVEGWGWVDAYYFCVVTLATVGYGDLSPVTTFGKIFTTFYIVAGVGILTTFISYTARRRAHLLEQRHGKRLGRQREESSDQ